MVGCRAPRCNAQVSPLVPWPELPPVSPSSSSTSGSGSRPQIGVQVSAAVGPASQPGGNGCAAEEHDGTQPLTCGRVSPRTAARRSPELWSSALADSENTFNWPAASMNSSHARRHITKPTTPRRKQPNDSGCCGSRLMASRGPETPPCLRPLFLKGGGKSPDSTLTRSNDSLAWRQSQMHKEEAHRLMGRITSFDRRRTRARDEALQSTTSEVDDHNDSRPKNLPPELALSLDFAAALGSAEVVSQTRDEQQEQELRYQVVCVSSQKKQGDLNLHSPGSHWETASMCVVNEFIVVEFEKPAHLAAVQFCLPHDNTAPRQCALASSKESPDGPWRDAWSFRVPSNMAYSFRSNGNYDDIEHVRLFVNACIKAYGSLNQAFGALDINGDGKLSYPEFVMVLNADHGGAITLDDLRRFAQDGLEAVLPEARWWRLLVLNNHGAPKRMQMVGPLRFFTVVTVTVLGMLDSLKANMQGSGLMERLALVVQNAKLAQSFDLEDLELSDKSMMARRLSKKHALPLLDVESVQDLFGALDVDKSGNLEVCEFKQLLLKLTGLASDQISFSKVQFWWNMADLDRSGEVNLEECLEFLTKYGKDLSGPKSSRMTLLG
mmetsp:Transcript_32225/g.90686  ORF Transcript_32225/g.90686 Transcript_32225/m.90686 type:complete len:608 (-) Transcript_32225:20-1843(-)